MDRQLEREKGPWWVRERVLLEGLVVSAVLWGLDRLMGWVQ